MVNIFEYKIGVAAEELSRYCPCGYHPIHLHDALDNGRYEVLHKLGFGAFATVWLARDNHTNKNVAVKVVTADKSSETNRELGILQALKDRGNDPDHPGYKHVSHLLGSFHVEGPNGRHLCVVLDILGPSTSSVADRCTNYRLDAGRARSISRQLLLAVDYLHSVNVAHGDIHMGNILFRLPDLEAASPETIIQDLGPPEVGKIERLDGKPVEPGIPEYLVEPVDFDREMYPRLGEIKLVDFGESFFSDDPPTRISTPPSHHPPELVFQHTLSKAVDVWNLGSTVSTPNEAATFDRFTNSITRGKTYELVIGRTPFEADFDNTRLIPQFQKVVGGVPKQWIPDALASGVLKDQPDWSIAEDFAPLEEEIRRSYSNGFESKTLHLGEAELEILGNYLRKLLVVCPDDRATTRQLLDDPWVS